MDNNILAEDVQKQSSIALKWSFFAEISAKIISPVIYIALARLLMPDILGIVATISIILTFTEIFTDAGFQKYVIQFDSKNAIEYRETINVATWSSLIVSLIVLLLIFLFRNNIAVLLGVPKLGEILFIGCLQLPLVSLSGLIMSLLKRKLCFKQLFYIQLISVIIPVIITIPLAYSGFSYWSIIIGDFAKNFIKFFILFWDKGNWPVFKFSFLSFKKMLPFASWTILDAFLIWISAYTDIFIISNSFDMYHLGLYKNTLNIINGIYALPFSATTAVLYPVLCMLKFKNLDFNNYWLKIQRFLGSVLIPGSIIIYWYSEFIVVCLLGNKWIESSCIFGLWAITSAIRIPLVSLYSDIYRAKGMPRLCFLMQLMDICILIPVCIYGVQAGWDKLVIWRALVKLDLVVPNIFVVIYITKVKFINLILNFKGTIIFSVFIWLLIYLLRRTDMITQLSLEFIFVTIVYIVVECVLNWKMIKQLMPSR